MTSPLVQAHHLSKVYGNGTRAVVDATFDIQPGETVGLVGESGSGKSTVAAMLLRLEDPTSGSVVFDGRDITRMPRPQLRRLRRDMQLVMQDPVSSLNRRRTVGSILATPMQVHTSMGKQEIATRTRELLDLVGLPESFVGRLPSEMSGGQCQRVGIARALALNPSFIVLDESVSAIDVLVQAQILNLLKELQRELGLTYLFVSHDLAVVRYMASRIVVMRKGEIVEQGGREAIFRHANHPYTRELMAAAPAALAAQHLAAEA